MKIIIERNDKTETFEGVEDYYLAVRSAHTLSNADGDIIRELQTKSYSCDSGHLRELIKELRQSIFELEDIRRERS